MDKLFVILLALFFCLFAVYGYRPNETVKTLLAIAAIAAIASSVVCAVRVARRRWKG